MRKRITLYSTTYPAHEGRRWLWFDKAVYGEHLPKVGNLPTEVFNKLTGGKPGMRSRSYTSRDEAIRDLDRTGCVEEAPPGTKAIKPRDWLVPTNLVLKKKETHA